jgi:hypothetical protein
MHMRSPIPSSRPLLLLLVLLLQCFSAVAQSVNIAKREDTREAAEGVVAALATNNIAGAIKQMRAFSPLPEQQLDVFEAQFAGQMAEIRRRVGDGMEHEYLRSDELGARLIRHQFLIHHARAPMRWVLVFYRSTRGWVLNDVRFDGSTLDFYNSPIGQPRPQ